VKYTRDIRKLHRDMLVGQVVSVLVVIFGILAIFLYIDPALIGTPLEQHGYYRGNSIWLIFGISFVIFGIFFVIIGITWPRRLLWVWKNVSPQPMRLSVSIQESSDSTDYQAILSAKAGKKKHGTSASIAHLGTLRICKQQQFQRVSILTLSHSVRQ
jgi:hypothetical protein